MWVGDGVCGWVGGRSDVLGYTRLEGPLNMCEILAYQSVDPPVFYMLDHVARLGGAPHGLPNIRTLKKLFIRVVHHLICSGHPRTPASGASCVYEEHLNRYVHHLD